MNENKNLKLEIGVHTDYHGDSSMNKQLSSIRAYKISQYIIEMGINPDRITTYGYGENRPIIVSAEINEAFPFLLIGERLSEDYIKKLTLSEQQEIANKLNSRTTIKIIEVN